MVLDETRYYRKKLASHGLIYLGGDELKITVRNLSITGLLAELDEMDTIRTIDELFKLIQVTPVVDIYLLEMRLAGEAAVVRADIIDQHIAIALEFVSISHDVDNVLYKRKAYRKNMTAPGQIIFNDKNYHFLTKNVSVDGLMILINENIEVKEGEITLFDFQHLNLTGEIKVAWVEHLEQGETLIGLEYIHIQKDSIKGIPRFEVKSYLD